MPKRRPAPAPPAPSPPRPIRVRPLRTLRECRLREIGRVYATARAGRMSWSDACKAAFILAHLRDALLAEDVEGRILALKAPRRQAATARLCWTPSRTGDEAQSRGVATPPGRVGRPTGIEAVIPGRASELFAGESEGPAGGAGRAGGYGLLCAGPAGMCQRRRMGCPIRELARPRLSVVSGASGRARGVPPRNPTKRARGGPARGGWWGLFSTSGNYHQRRSHQA